MYSSMQKFTIIMIIKTAIFITIMLIILILPISNYLNYRTALYICMHVHICMYVCTYMHVCVHVHICMHVCLYMYVAMYIYH